MFTLTTGTNHQRAAVRDWLAGLDALQPDTAERVVTAWVTTWACSDWAELDAIPFSAHAPGYPLARHVNEVTRAGQALMRRAEADWGVALDPEIMLPILILHDVDKPLLAKRDAAGTVRKSDLAQRMPHGVVGAMLLRELGFDQRIVETVATHATDAPFHNDSAEAHVLHYADLFAADHALRAQGATPFYRRR
jgi:putative nucleotidyltransferase with HDIG domain